MEMVQDILDVTKAVEVVALHQRVLLVAMVDLVDLVEMVLQLLSQVQLLQEAEAEVVQINPLQQVLVDQEAVEQEATQ